ncbi:hypothetical protein J6590_038697 [Homalodisca vitripennis]|nr:hypothetical protein J6590_038697 [Homalodisca vitripennis]
MKENPNFHISLSRASKKIFTIASITSAAPKAAPRPEPEPAPIAYDLDGILNAVLKILYALARGENIGLSRLLG